MHHLKRLLFGIIFISFFGSAFSDEYDSRQDVFDQLINTLVPTLIIFLFDTKQTKEEELEERKKKRIITITRIRQVFDDFLFLLSLFVLPSIVFYKNHEKFATPLWIPILFGVTAVFVFIILNIIYMGTIFKPVIETFPVISPLAIDLCHIISDICFIFYTQNIPVSDFTAIFIYLHAVTGILGMIVLLFYIGFLLMYKKFRYLYNENKINILRIERFLRQSTISITFIWTPIVQMLNMSLLSGNDYYWTKLILALNMIYFSRVINYVQKGVKNKNKVVNRDKQFGLLSIVFHAVHRINDG